MRYALFVLFLSAFRIQAQVDLEAERRAMLNGDVHGVITRLEHALEAPASRTSAVHRARMLETLGEQYHRLSDIGHAERYWNEALRLRQQAYGDSSAEAAVGYAYRARYHNYMAAPSPDHQPLAWREAERALRLSPRSDKSTSSFARILIHREAGYAWKVAFGGRGIETHDLLERSRLHYRHAMRIATVAGDTIWTAQLAHDIGNTFTDEAGYYKSVRSRAANRPLVDSALFHYRNSIRLMQACGMATSEAVMMDHFTTALLYYYNYAHDSIAKVTAAYDRALRTMIAQAGHPPDVDPFTFEPRVGNKAQMIELLTLRATALANYHQADGPRLLPEALSALEAAVPYWDAMLQEYRSEDFHKVVGSYNHFPFQSGTRVLADLHRLTGDERYLHQALQWFDRNRDALERRNAERSGQRMPSVTAHQPSMAYRTRPGTACVAIHAHHHIVTFSIGSEQVETRILDGHEWNAFDPWAFVADLKKAIVSNDPQSYRRNAFRIYQATIADALADPDITELILIPSEGLNTFPFEALVTDTLGPAQWSALHYVNGRCAVRYARTIQEALAPHVPLRMAAMKAAIAHAPGTAELPFATALVRRIGGSNATLHTGREDLLRLLAGDTPLHIASHAVAPSAPDQTPYLQLADGPLHLYDLDTAHNGTPFIVLSTCSSGEGRHYSGVGTLSLGNALLRSGSSTVVQTLWPVDDQATSEILHLMYAEMANGTSASQALAQAKASFINMHRNDALSNPFYWSGIILTGRDADPTTPTKRWTWLVAGMASLVLIAGTLYRVLRRSRRSRALAANS
ncbi:MAG: CHAT domain-containing protein [Flavobacteriales bacterium]|nr:CHAT domain-containing protein [Flavobacteriales bacterium]